MIKRYSDSEINPRALVGKRLAMIGYGSQGRGQALNLRDSGIDVCIGLRETGSTSWQKAVADGWEPQLIKDAGISADLIAMMTPDMSHASIYENFLKSFIKPDATFLFAHGFSIHFKSLSIPSNHNVILVAPKGPGATVRSLFQDGQGVAALIAVHHDATGDALELALAYGAAIGSARTGMLETTFAEETETDLFSEQAILCGGLPELILAGWETLVEAGYQPEIAYFECLHEVKLIADLLYAGGLSKMYELISETAAFGGLINGDRVFGESSRSAMREILAEIRNGEFAQRWQAFSAANQSELKKLIAQKRSHSIESIGDEVRRRFTCIKSHQ